jgi:hypothetical protein
LLPLLLLLLLLLQVSVFNVYQRDGANNTPLFPGHAVEVRRLQAAILF